MYFLHRWWERYRAGLLLLCLTTVGAWYLRQSDAALVTEISRFLSQPWQPPVNKQEELLQAHTWELQQRIAELEAQNQQFQKLLRQPGLAQGQSFPAVVIGRSADHWWQQLTLNKGSQDGVQDGSVITAPGGLVGRVISTTPHTSRVLLLTDSTSRVGVVVGRKREMGILRGQADNQAIIEFFVREPKVQVGEAVVTSSLSSLFPSGLPIGKIVAIDLRDPSKPQAIVMLAAPISALEWVMVSPYVQQPGQPQAVAAPRP